MQALSHKNRSLPCHRSHVIWRRTDALLLASAPWFGVSFGQRMTHFTFVLIISIYSTVTSEMGVAADSSPALSLPAAAPGGPAPPNLPPSAAAAPAGAAAAAKVGVVDDGCRSRVATKAGCQCWSAPGSCWKVNPPLCAPPASFPLPTSCGGTRVRSCLLAAQALPLRPLQLGMISGAQRGWASQHLGLRGGVSHQRPTVPDASFLREGPTRLRCV